jgi:hypothetical protein
MANNEIVVYPVPKLEDTDYNRTILQIIRNGLMEPSQDFARAMAMEILRLWGDPNWNKY